MRGKGEQQAAEPWVSAAWGCWGARGHQRHGSRHRVLPSPSRLCWLMLWAALPRCFSWGGPGMGKETGDGWGGNVTLWGGRAALLATRPPHAAGCGVRSHIGASPPAPRPGVLERCHKCHNAVRSQPAPARRRLILCPRLSPAWFSLACFLCHTVQSLGFGGGCAL